MKTYLVCIVLFANAFPLEAGITTRHGEHEYRSGFTIQMMNFALNFFNKDKENDPILSQLKIEMYHLNDNNSWNLEDAEGEIANPGLYKNENLFNSITAVVKISIAKIDEKMEDANRQANESAEAAKAYGKASTPQDALLLEAINKRMAAKTIENNSLKSLRAALDPYSDMDEYVSVQHLITALFNVIIIHKSEGGKEKELTLHEFLYFMSEEPAEAESIPALIHTAFKEYVLGLINHGSVAVITLADLEQFLRVHCAMDGELSGSFEYFAKDMKSSRENSVEVSDVSEKWAKMDVVSAFNTLVNPKYKVLQTNLSEPEAKSG